MRRASELEAHLHICYEALDTRSFLFSDGADNHGREAVRSIIILGGTAELITQALVARAGGATHPDALPVTYECLLAVAYTSFDARILSDVPIGGRLGFAHISELLMRAGELRLFAAPAPDMTTSDRLLWAKPDQLVRDACSAYHRFQRCRWAWPSRGLPGLFG
jgi:hypothetical protein